MTCPLCYGESSVFLDFKNRIYNKCCYCSSVFMDCNCLPNYEQEKERYLLHQNDVFDEGYRSFVSPLVSYISQRFTAFNLGLDFGSGFNSAVSQMLKEIGMSIFLYDPFFQNNKKLLTDRYDYIICCEVIEHFHKPHDNFALLRSMLKPGGEIVCMTNILEDNADFKNWSYKNDFTHVFFYHRKAFKFIADEFKFSKPIISGRLIVLGVDI